MQRKFAYDCLAWAVFLLVGGLWQVGWDGFTTRAERLESRRTVREAYSRLEIGMTRAEAERVVKAYWPTQPGDHYRTPMELGATAWSLVLDFDEERLAAVVVRSDDSLQWRPQEAPPDRIRPGFQPSWECP